MSLLFNLIAHLLVTLARLAKPGGLGAVVAESLAVKHQLLILRRARRRAPYLTSWDRMALGVCTLLVSPEQDGCDTEAFHLAVLPPRPGEAQVSLAL